MLMKEDDLNASEKELKFDAKPSPLYTESRQPSSTAPQGSNWRRFHLRNELLHTKKVDRFYFSLVVSLE
jgi:hypothetical protein